MPYEEIPQTTGAAEGLAVVGRHRPADPAESAPLIVLALGEAVPVGPALTVAHGFSSHLDLLYQV